MDDPADLSLADFLLARIEEDELTARAAIIAEAGWAPYYSTEVRDDDDALVAHAVGAQGAGHIARWDPARVLAECSAKRAIVEHPWSEDSGDEEADWRWGIHAAAHDKVLCLLAVPYADHPHYQEGWAP